MPCFLFWPKILFIYVIEFKFHHHCYLYQNKIWYSLWTEELKVKVELFNGIPLSASVPKHVTCIVKEAQPPVKGIAATPKYVFIVQMLLFLWTSSHYSMLLCLSVAPTPWIITWYNKLLDQFQCWILVIILTRDIIAKP